MSEASLEVETPVAAINPASSRVPEESGHSAVDNPDLASGPKDIQENAISLGRGSDPSLILHRVLQEIHILRVSLLEAIDQAPKQDAQEGESSTARPYDEDGSRLRSALNEGFAQESKKDAQVGESSTARPYDEDGSKLRSSYRKELERLERIHGETELPSKRSEILSLLTNIFEIFPRRWTNYRGPIFRFKLPSEPPEQTYDCVVISYSRLIDMVSPWLNAQRHWERRPKVPTYWCPIRADHIAPKHAIGSFWWVTDDPKPEHCFGVGLDRGRARTMDISTLIFLAGCCMKGRNDDMVNEEKAFQEFIMSFSNLSHPLAKRSLVDLSYEDGPSGDRLGLQYHLSHLAPVGLAELDIPMSSPQTEGLVLERQFFRIRRVSHASIQRGDKKMDDEQYFGERILSVSLMMNQHLGTFYITVLGDKGVIVDTGNSKVLAFDGTEKESSHLDREALGTGAGLSHFLIALVWLLETWHQGWNATLDAIDDIVGFHGDHTFDDEQLESYIFDSSGSMALCKQYFTVLQLLRTARQQVDVNSAEWKVFCDNATGNDDHFEIFIFLRKLVPSGAAHDEWLKCWKAQIDKVTELLQGQTEHLKGRIDRKTEEVESLRDGLLNATSLREAMKGMALNRAIYVFTAVTVIYTPLGFMAALWALPILNNTPAGDDTPASSTALVASFVVVPIFTYVGCGYLAWYFTSTRSWESFSQYVKDIPRSFWDWGFRTARNRKTGIRIPVRSVKARPAGTGIELA